MKDEVLELKDGNFFATSSTTLKRTFFKYSSELYKLLAGSFGGEVWFVGAQLLHIHCNVCRLIQWQFSHLQDFD